jgi:[protein-PII] uridylyltransferase
MITHQSKAARSLDRQRRDIQKQPGADLCERLSAACDAYFQRRLAELPPHKTPRAMIAVGGYGRAELCPRSDIDVLILYAKSVPKDAADLAKAVFHPLWDLGADLGHGVRSIPETLSLANEDWKVFASLVDARFLAGDKAVFDDFAKRFQKRVSPGAVRGFKEWLEGENVRRAAVHGDAAGMLEPNLKEALGGLRDIHQMRWLHKLSGSCAAGIPGPWLGVIEEHAGFLLGVRNHLHVLEGRKSDRLSLDAQRALAPKLGFAAKDEMLDVELFLTELHRVMAEIRTLHRALWPHLCGKPVKAAKPKPVGGAVVLAADGLGFDETAGKRARPGDVLDIFAQAARLDQPLLLSARRGIEAGLSDLAGFAATVEGGRRAFDLLLQLLTHEHAEEALAALFETGVIGAIIPEFERVRHMVQYDVFHVHPVGRHTLETILELKQAARPGHPYHAVFSRAQNPLALYLGALFHDIGKGLGGAHSEKGAAIARDVLTRAGLPDDVVSDVSFLTLRHLILADTAIRRDIADRDVLAACAQKIGAPERLDMLLLLTMADSLATGPSAWNDWKAALIGDLYRRILNILEGGGLFAASEAKALLAQRDWLSARARGLFSSERIEACLDAMPPRYLLSRAAPSILADLKLVSRLDQALEEDRLMHRAGVAGRGVTVLDTAQSPAGDGWAVTLAARGQPGLFAVMAGVLALYGINIRSADFFIWNDDTEIHAYQTSNPPDTLFPAELWGRVRRAVRYALTGKLSLDYRIQEKRSSPLAPRQPDMGVKPRVALDNAASEYFTVMEVKASDRLGLLYDMAVAMESLGVVVRMAKIDTQGYEVHDVFYLRGPNNKKITDEAKLKEIKAVMLASLS